MKRKARATVTLRIITPVILAACLSGCAATKSYYEESVKRNTATQKQLDQVVDLSGLKEETAFEEALDILRNSVDPPLNVVVMWNDISENAFIEKERLIGISGRGLSNVSLRTGLKLVLRAVGGVGDLSELDYIIDDGLVTIATKDSLPTYTDDDTDYDADFDGLGGYGDGAGGPKNITPIQGDQN